MPFLTWMRNSFIAAGLSTFLSLAIGSLAGYSVARLRFLGAGMIGMGIFITYLVPRTLLFLPLAHVLRSLGLANSVVSLIIAYPTFLVPFCTWILMGYFATIPKEIEECAIIDGCSRIGAFVRIVLPLATPGIIAAGVFAFTLSWTEFVYALSFIQLESQKVLTVGVVGQLVKGDVFLWGSLMAAALMASIPIAAIYGVLQRHFISGLTAGAVKY
ncbi:MAG: carbohydrate ABC transporter permease [bacterium]